MIGPNASSAQVLISSDEGGGPPPPVGVTSWNGRTGAVVPEAGDYDTDLVNNASSVPGGTDTDALDFVYLQAQIAIGMITAETAITNGPGAAIDVNVNDLFAFLITLTQAGHTLNFANGGGLPNGARGLFWIKSTNALHSITAWTCAGGTVFFPGNDPTPPPFAVGVTMLGWFYDGTDFYISTTSALASTVAGGNGLMSQADKVLLAAIAAGAVPSSRTLTAGAGLTGGGNLTADRTFNVGANADGSIVVNADDVQIGVLATDVQHGARGGGTQHAVATGAANGFMSAADKTKLDGLGAVLQAQAVLATNKTTTNVANPPATDVLVTLTPTIAGTFLLIRAMAHVSGSTGIRVYFAIYVDGVLKARDWAFMDVVSGEGESSFEVLVTGLATGARQIDLMWSVNTAATAVCNPLANPELYRATLTAQYS